MRPQENHDVKGSSKIRTRLGSVARGIKAKHSRSRKHRNVNCGEIRETAYHANLNGIKKLIEELNLSDEYNKIMKKTPCLRRNLAFKYKVDRNPKRRARSSIA
ncbi:hypothetical protein RHMOL_Rhmol03G0075300 [Rhododendron molle]|uniref:Uncharacterized protein n=1 Tax=Rhododendron molle TaxID=49168 RepID=A0ACC0PD15_RHOML|nr:hypothetical protein RHMOL_Rhmol03G0075300 [Rhododendron molle]